MANLALLLASSLAGLALCEVGLRLLHPEYRHLAEAAFVRDPALIFSPVPDNCGAYPHPDTGMPHSMCHNKLGLRQHRNFSAIDLESSVNIAFFGDSFTANPKTKEAFGYLNNQRIKLNGVQGRPLQVVVERHLQASAAQTDEQNTPGMGLPDQSQEHGLGIGRGQGQRASRVKP